MEHICYSLLHSCSGPSGRAIISTSKTTVEAAGDENIRGFGAMMIKPDSLRYHPEFDMAAAREVYASFAKKTPLRGEQISSPYDLYSVEELRDRLKLRIGRSFPTDVFVFCKGEPEKPDCTKVGGIPYWINDRDWPRNQAGKPLQFLAQFNFLDSKDLFDKLPSDVLLMFVDSGMYSEFDTIYFEWLPAGGAHVATTDSKRMFFPKTAFYGAIYRTADYPDSRKLAYEACNSWPKNLPLLDSWPKNLPLLNGTKIGGRPHFIQSDDNLEAVPEMRRENPFRPGEMMTIPARPPRKGYLCQLGSIHAHSDVKYPWANQKKSLKGFHEIQNEDNIDFVDMGSIYVSRAENGDLWNEFEFY